MYAIKVKDNGRIGYATFPEYAVDEKGELMKGFFLVDSIPEDDLSNYRYVEDAFLYEPQTPEMEMPTQMDRIEAQLTYTAMMTETLLEV